MVSCKHCHTPNTLDSTFCKRCGVEIPDADLKEGQAKLEKLIEEGNALFNQARIDDALAMADAAVAANPSNTAALSLKALCHERRGEIAEALEAAEKIVDLNPDSDFDRIRRTTLRQKLQAEFHVGESPDRRTALVGAVAAVVLVICAGVYAARATGASSRAVAQNEIAGTVSPQTASNSGTPPTTAPPQNTTGGAVPQNSAGGNSTAQDQNSNQNQNQGNGGTTGNGEGDTPRTPSRPRINYGDQGAGAEGGTLPSIGDPGVTISGITPVQPPAPPATSTKEIGDDANVRTPAANPPATSNPAPAEEPSVMEIHVHSGSGPSVSRAAPSGSQTMVSTNGVEAMVRVGSQQFMLGNYEAAAKEYEQALQNGGDSIVLNRRLGQAYQRLGRTGDAAEAYKRCITAVDTALAAGHGNRDWLMSTRDLCQQAIKVLGG